MVENDPAWSKLKGRVYFDFTGSQIGGKINLPLDEIGFKGRYVTGEASLNVSLESGLLLVFLDRMVVNDEPLPEQFMAGLRNVNLAAKAMEKRETVETLKKIGSLTVRNGVVYLTGAGNL